MTVFWENSSKLDANSSKTPQNANFVDRILVETMARRRKARLILNGDVFDFLSMVRLPPQEIIRESGMQISGEEHKYGLGTSPTKSAWKIEKIMWGHPLFFRALLRFAHAGHPTTDGSGTGTRRR